MAEVFGSILALYQYDPSIFDDIHIPTGLDVGLVTDEIMLELSEMGLIYTDPVYMKYAIERWSASELDIWEKLYATTLYDYDAIENYNKTESTTETLTKTHDLTELETRDLSGSNNEVRDLDGLLVTDGSDVVTKEVNAFNSGTGTQSGKDSSEQGRVDTTEDNGSIDRTLTDTGTVKDETTGTVIDSRVVSTNNKGNIGVTTSQQMIQQERDVVQFSIYKYITDSFKTRFCVMVW